MSWIQLTDKIISAEEIRWLIAMDNAWIGTIAQERADKKDREEQEANRKKSGSK